MELDLHSAFDATSLHAAGKDIAVVRLVAGELELPSGTIAALDPLSAVTDTPFTRAVPPGTYRVELLHATIDSSGDKRFALARVVLAAGMPVHWELAVRAGEEARSLRPGQVYGYAVDAGTGCFVDGGDLQGGRSDELLEMIATDLRATDSFLCWPASGPAKLVAFKSGYGDGVYPSWWGLDADGRALELVTDFNIGELSRPTIPDDPDYRRQWARAQFDSLVTAVRELAAGNDDARMTAFSATAELVSLDDEAGEILPDLIRALRSYKHDDVSAEPLIRLAKVLARHEAFQPDVAAWLTTAPKELAAAFTFEHGLRRIQDELGRVMAKIMSVTQPMLLVPTVNSLYGLEEGYEPFRPWLITLAHRKDDVGHAAKNVLRNWGF